MSGPSTQVSPARVLVLGIGNVLWADEGFGVRCVEALHKRYLWPAQVSLVDGGTQGMYLLDPVCDAEHVLVLDAIDYKLAPGTVRVFRDAEVPVWADTTMSLHEASFQELLSLARLRNRFPNKLTLIGVQAEVLDDLGGSLSPVVRARLDEAVELAVAELQAWGIEAVPRDAPPQDSLSPAALALQDYEAGRPTAQDACRIGDARFLMPTPPRHQALEAAGLRAAPLCPGDSAAAALGPQATTPPRRAGSEAASGPTR